MTIDLLITFILASSLISIAPGPDNVFVLTQSALYGRKSGMYITLGLCSGLIVHTALVALGLGTIFQDSPLAFNLLKYIGASYLIYLAWLSFRAPPSNLYLSKNEALSYSSLYFRGVVMNITNPKVSIFFLAFLPQFTQPENGYLVLQFLFLGLLFILIAFALFLMISILASSLGSWFNDSPKKQCYLNRLAAAVFVGLAIKLITASLST